MVSGSDLWDLGSVDKKDVIYKRERFTPDKRKESERELRPDSAWLRELDLNQRPSGYEPDELPNCSIPRYLIVPLR